MTSASIFLVTISISVLIYSILAHSAHMIAIGKDEPDRLCTTSRFICPRPQLHVLSDFGCCLLFLLKVHL